MALLTYRVEIQLAGVWTDITQYVRSGPISLQRGSADESPKATPATASLSLHNNDDRFNPRNPLGPYFGKLKRNTPIRIASMQYDTIKGLWTPALTVGGASAPDTAALDIVGDLDIRAEVPIYQSDYYWITKQLAYALRSSGGFLQLQWIKSSVTITRTSTVAIPASHKAFRATLDVDNGAAGHTVTFYSAQSWGDPWVQLGATVTTAGVTSIDSGAGLALLGGTTNDTGPLCVRQAEIRNGIGGTVVASPNPSIQPNGTTSFMDAQANTWTLISTSSIGYGGPWFRFYGEVFAWPPKWNEDRTDCTVDVQASGALRRVVQLKRPPRSYYRSWVNTHTTSPTVKYFWSLEDGGDAGGGQPDIGQGNAYYTNQPPNGGWGEVPFNDWLANGAAIPASPASLNTAYTYLNFPCDMSGSTASAWEVTMLLNFDNQHTSMTGQINAGVLQHFWAIGTDAFTDPNNPVGSITVYTFALATGGFQSATYSNLPPLQNAGPMWLTIRSWWNGINQITYCSFQPVGNASNAITIFIPSTWATSSAQRPTSMQMAAYSDDGGEGGAQANLGVSQVSVSECLSSTTSMENSYVATKGGQSEWTFDRFSRLGLEFGFNVNPSGNGSVQLGKQYAQGFEDHLNEILASSAHGGIVESRAANELLLLGTGTYRGTINYTDLLPPLEPIEDDQKTANIVQYTNSHGLTATMRKTTGPMSVADIGPFETEVKANNWTVSQGLALAGKRLAEGTWEGPRFATIKMSAQAAIANGNPSLYDMMRSIEVGDFFGMQGASAAGYYDTLIFRVTCINEEITPEDHTFEFTVKPGEIDYRQWAVAVNVIDIADSTVISDGGSTIDVNVPTAKWTVASGAFFIMVSGEQMVVTGVATLSATSQRLNVIRAANGVAKTAPAGAEVHVYPAYFIKAA